MSASPLIVCDNLVRLYKIANLEVVALQGLDLIISDGELVGVVGASGSGKSDHALFWAGWIDPLLDGYG